MMIEIEPVVFSGVEPGDRPPKACYPSLPRDPQWRGVVIALPAVVRLQLSEAELRERVNVLLCGVTFVQVPSEPDPVDLILRVRRSGSEEWIETPLTYVPPPGIEVGPLVPPPDPDPSADISSLANTSVQEKFHRNLLNHLNVVPGATDYEVSVRLRDYVSNVESLRIEWTFEESSG